MIPRLRSVRHHTFVLVLLVQFVCSAVASAGTRGGDKGPEVLGVFTRLSRDGGEGSVEISLRRPLPAGSTIALALGPASALWGTVAAYRAPSVEVADVLRDADLDDPLYLDTVSEIAASLELAPRIVSISGDLLTFPVVLAGDEDPAVAFTVETVGPLVGGAVAGVVRDASGANIGIIDDITDSIDRVRGWINDMLCQAYDYLPAYSLERPSDCAGSAVPQIDLANPRAIRAAYEGHSGLAASLCVGTYDIFDDCRDASGATLPRAQLFFPFSMLCQAQGDFWIGADFRLVDALNTGKEAPADVRILGEYHGGGAVGTPLVTPVTPVPGVAVLSDQIRVDVARRRSTGWDVDSSRLLDTDIVIATPGNPVDVLRQDDSFDETLATTIVVGDTHRTRVVDCAAAIALGAGFGFCDFLGRDDRDGVRFRSAEFTFHLPDLEVSNLRVLPQCEGCPLDGTEAVAIVAVANIATHSRAVAREVELTLIDNGVVENVTVLADPLGPGDAREVQIGWDTLGGTFGNPHRLEVVVESRATAELARVPANNRTARAGVIVHPSKKVAFASAGSSGQPGEVHLYDTRLRADIGTVSLGAYQLPLGIAIEPDGKSGWVVVRAGGSPAVASFDTLALALSAAPATVLSADGRYADSATVYGIASRPIGGEVLVPFSDTSARPFVALLDTTSGAYAAAPIALVRGAGETVKTVASPANIDVASSGGREIAFVPSTGHLQVNVVDIASRTSSRACLDDDSAHRDCVDEAAHDNEVKTNEFRCVAFGLRDGQRHGAAALGTDLYSAVGNQVVDLLAPSARLASASDHVDTFSVDVARCNVALMPGGTNRWGQYSEHDFDTMTPTARSFPGRYGEDVAVVPNIASVGAIPGVPVFDEEAWFLDGYPTRIVILPVCSTGGPAPAIATIPLPGWPHAIEFHPIPLSPEDSGVVSGLVGEAIDEVRRLVDIPPRHDAFVRAGPRSGENFETRGLSIGQGLPIWPESHTESVLSFDLQSIDAEQAERVVLRLYQINRGTWRTTGEIRVFRTEPLLVPDAIATWDSVPVPGAGEAPIAVHSPVPFDEGWVETDVSAAVLDALANGEPSLTLRLTPDGAYQHIVNSRDSEWTVASLRPHLRVFGAGLDPASGLSGMRLDFQELRLARDGGAWRGEGLVPVVNIAATRRRLALAFSAPAGFTARVIDPSVLDDVPPFAYADSTAALDDGRVRLVRVEASATLAAPPGTHLVAIGVGGATPRAALRVHVPASTPPSLDIVEPPRLLPDGGALTLHGRGLAGVTGVELRGAGTEVALEFAAHSDRELGVLMPAGVAPGSYRFAIAGAARAIETPPLLTIDEFGEAPAIDAIEPPAGPAAGGQEVTIIGSGFDETTIVLLCGEPLEAQTLLDEWTLEGRTPAGIAGSLCHVTVYVGCGSAARSRLSGTVESAVRCSGVVSSAASAASRVEHAGHSRIPLRRRASRGSVPEVRVAIASHTSHTMSPMTTAVVHTDRVVVGQPRRARDHRRDLRAGFRVHRWAGPAATVGRHPGGLRRGSATGGRTRPRGVRAVRRVSPQRGPTSSRIGRLRFVPSRATMRPSRSPGACRAMTCRIDPSFHTLYLASLMSSSPTRTPSRAAIEPLTTRVTRTRPPCGVSVMVSTSIPRSIRGLPRTTSAGTSRSWRSGRLALRSARSRAAS